MTTLESEGSMLLGVKETFMIAAPVKPAATALNETLGCCVPIEPIRPMIISGKVPNELLNVRYVESSLPPTAATSVNGGWGDIGFRTPDNENTITEFALKTPLKNLTVSTLLVMLATPAAPASGDVNVTGVFAAQLGDPDRVILSVKGEGKDNDGSNVIVIMTSAAPATTEESATVGASTRKMAPEGTLRDAVLSVDVVTDMPKGALKHGKPSTMPEIVAMNAEVPVAFPAVMRTKLASDTELLLAFRNGMLELPVSNVGTLVDAKKPDGKDTVILPPEGIDAEGVKLRVIGTTTLLSLYSLSFADICNETLTTEVGHSQRFVTGTRGQSALTATGL
jgi:hypothetical protein